MTPLSIILTASMHSRCAAHGNDVFTDAAMFERLSHFKDHGVPGTVDDPFNRAAIADGSCRMLNTSYYDAFAFFHQSKRADAVIAALAALPDTGSPSHFTLTAQQFDGPLATACLTPSKSNDLEFYNFSVVQGSVQNWYRALCSPTWEDPAYMPQQRALTLGFTCTVACDANAMTRSASAFGMVARNDDSAANAVLAMCEEIVWKEGAESEEYFLKAADLAELGKLMAPWVGTPCSCSVKKM